MYTRFTLLMVFTVFVASCAAPSPIPITSDSEVRKAEDAKDLMVDAIEGMAQMLEAAASSHPLDSKAYEDGRHYTVPEDTFGYGLVPGPMTIWSEYKAEWNQAEVETGHTAVVLAKGHDFSIESTSTIPTSQSSMNNEIDWNIINTWADLIIAQNLEVDFYIIEGDGKILKSVIGGR